MKDKSFFDTDLLIYSLADGDQGANPARDLLAEGGVVSVQVLNEFVAAARRKLKMPWTKVNEALANFRTLCPDPVPITITTHEAALIIAEKYGYRIYDSLVIAAAVEAECDLLYSEDMQGDQRIRGLTIKSPF